MDAGNDKLRYLQAIWIASWPRRTWKEHKEYAEKGGAYDVVTPTTHAVCSSVLTTTAEQLTNFLSPVSLRRGLVSFQRGIYGEQACKKTNFSSEYFITRSIIVPQMIIHISTTGWRTGTLDAKDPNKPL